ncbi:MAG: zinc ribbon domain-containing protein [Chloroflexi bacterium]|nr:zinc ribbon domain-containing protein [Chloroflexota bacterium]
MPIYEYTCDECHASFETIRRFAEMDAPAECPSCSGQHTHRILSTFFAFVGNDGAGTLETRSRALAGQSGGCGCGGACACGGH